ncbi:MAG: hypothetical protein LBV16_07365, partial [Elusimicrobiota bacterium]|nr:hypothetical protein [Elusimicrobiota bacterium]
MPKAFCIKSMDDFVCLKDKKNFCFAVKNIMRQIKKAIDFSMRFCWGGGGGKNFFKLGYEHFYPIFVVCGNDCLNCKITECQ